MAQYCLEVYGSGDATSAGNTALRTAAGSVQKNQCAGLINGDATL